MPIVIGSPRSGTTLLRLMLDAHPDLAIPPETGFLALSAPFATRDAFFDAVTTYPSEAPAWQDFQISREAFLAELCRIDPFTVSEGYRAFYRLYASRFHKVRWGDKTPTYCMHMDAIEAVLPEAHFIHVIRDGRDVALSLREMWFSPGREIDVQATQWHTLVSTARRQGASCRNYLEVRYEDLVLRAPLTLRRVCRFIDLPYDEAMMTYHERAPGRLEEHKARFRVDGSLLVSRDRRLSQQRKTMEPPDGSRVFAWKRTMRADERERFEAIAGDLLNDLGYETLRDRDGRTNG